MGWNLAAALSAKTLSNLGDHVAGMLINLDKKAGVEVGRDQIEEGLRAAAMKKAEAQQQYDAARKAREELSALIEKDKVRAQTLAEKLASKSVSEDIVMQFANDLEAAQVRLPQLQKAEDEAKHYLDTVQEVLAAFQTKLQNYDREAAEATNAMRQAEADQQQAQMRLASQRELQQLSAGTGGPSTALDALKAAANKKRLEADAAQTMAEMGSQQTRQQDAAAEARRIADGDSTSGESLQEKLARLAAK